MAYTERYVDASASGGGTGTQASPWTFDEAIANVAAGDRVNIKAGTYTCSQKSTTSGSSTQPISIRGYKTTIGDMDDLPRGNLVSGTDIPKVTNTSLTEAGFTGEFIRFNHISFQSNAAYIHGYRMGHNSWAKSCDFIGLHQQQYCALNGLTIALNDCYFENKSIYSAALKTINGSATNCVFVQTSSGTSVAASQNVASVSNCIFKSCNVGYFHEYNTTAVPVSNCTFVDCTTAIKSNYSYARPYLITNCYFDSCTTAIQQQSPSTNVGNWLIDSCCYRNVTTELDGPDFQSNRKTDSTDQFVDRANNDYTLQSSSAGYASSFPSKVVNYGTVNARDIGAVQHADPSGGGGGGSIFHPLAQ